MRNEEGWDYDGVEMVCYAVLGGMIFCFLDGLAQQLGGWRLIGLTIVGGGLWGALSVLASAPLAGWLVVRIRVRPLRHLVGVALATLIAWGLFQVVADLRGAPDAINDGPNRWET